MLCGCAMAHCGEYWCIQFDPIPVDTAVLCEHIRTCTYVRTYEHIYIYMCVYVCVCVCTCMYVCMYRCTIDAYVHTYQMAGEFCGNKILQIAPYGCVQKNWWILIWCLGRWCDIMLGIGTTRMIRQNFGSLTVSLSNRQSTKCIFCQIFWPYALPNTHGSSHLSTADNVWYCPKHVLCIG